MTRQLVYEDFRRSFPSEAAQKIHREHLAKKYANEAQRMMQLAKVRREMHAPYLKAMGELLEKHAGLRPAAMRKPAAGGPQRRLAELQTPAPPRLHQRIFRHGSFHLIDTPTSFQEPPWLGQPGYPKEPGFVGWADSLPANPSPGNDAFGTGSFDGVNTVSISVNAGNQQQSAGSAHAWGYVGQYYSVPLGVDFANVYPEAYFTVTVSPQIIYSVDWSTTFNPFAPWIQDHATLTLKAELLCEVFDDQWNYLRDILTNPTPPVYSIDQATGSVDPEQTFREPWPMSFTTFAPTDAYYGIFVAISAFAYGAGASTGTWVPGSFANGTITAQLPFVRIDGECLQQ